MCTLTLFWRVFPDAPVVVAANRDENPQRPWSDPQHWDGIFAGRDEVAGGTWLGLGDGGVVCGITNRWGPANDPMRGSRGVLVRDALHAASAEAAAKLLSARAPDETNAYGLLVADGTAAFRLDCDGARIDVTPLSPGVTVLANWSAAEKRPRSDRALALAAEVPTSSFDAARPALERLVADHDGAEVPGQAICVHGDRYATVCSTLLAVAVAGGGTVRWRDTRGNPCVAPWTERQAR